MQVGPIKNPQSSFRFWCSSGKSGVPVFSEVWSRRNAEFVGLPWSSFMYNFLTKMFDEVEWDLPGVPPGGR
jgi:hypothetical protein